MKPTQTRTLLTPAGILAVHAELGRWGSFVTVTVNNSVEEQCSSLLSPKEALRVYGDAWLEALA